jgi:PTH1 family peptidyl-tRNA hydrolase
VDFIIVVGLGNPGTEYDGTRHNIGFEVIDELTRRFKTTMRSGWGEYLIASHRVAGKILILAKPMTYVNNSGIAAKELLEGYGALISQLIVIADDLALPLGKIRVRAKGSDGGHNGLHSIIYQLNSDEFARIRCGIRREVMPPNGRMADFVLSPFEKGERATVDEMIKCSADAAVEFSVSGIAKAMNRFNTRS